METWEAEWNLSGWADGTGSHGGHVLLAGAGDVETKRMRWPSPSESILSGFPSDVKRLVGNSWVMPNGHQLTA